jgi:MtN3 and saliva related transmembrane protein
MDTVNLLGYVATILSSFTFLPQVVDTWKTKSTKDFSRATLIIGFLSSLLWLVYGIMLNAFPIILANLVVMSSWLIILLFKLKYT